VSCSNDRATITIGSYTILLLQSSSSNIPSHSWPNQSSDMAKWSSRGADSADWTGRYGRGRGRRCSTQCVKRMK